MTMMLGQEGMGAVFKIQVNTLSSQTLVLTVTLQDLPGYCCMIQMVLVFPM